MTLNIKGLPNKQLLEIFNNIKGEFYHADDYWVDEKMYFTEGDCRFHHTVFSCINNNGDEWFGHWTEMIDKLTHVDTISDEVTERGLLD